MKIIKAFWKSWELMYGSIVGGTIGSIIALYLESGNISYYSILFPVIIIFGILTFIIYFIAKDEIKK